MKDLESRSGAELAEHQLERLRALLREVVASNAFYAPRVRAAGLAEGVTSLEEFVERMPFTTKAELAADQREHPPHGTNLGAPLEHFVRLHQTSSTSGEPLRWLDTERNWSWMVDGWQRVFEAAGVRPTDRVFFAFSFGPFIGLWVAFAAAERMGCLTIPGGAMNSSTRARAIVANEATVLCCTPTYAERLGQVAAEEGIDPARSKVRAIVVGGEPGASIPAVRARVEAMWPGARMYDHHGMTEAGPVSLPCPARRDVLHVMESAYLAEVVDPRTGAPHDPASEEPGELVLTTLGRFDSPVLRYRTGDLVRAAHGTCECGRVTLRLEGGVLARADEMVVVRGVNLYPGSLDQVVRGFDALEEYRVEVGSKRAMTELKLLVEPAPRCTDAGALCRDLQGALQRAYNLRIPVEAVARGELPRFELKAKRWVRTAGS